MRDPYRDMARRSGDIWKAVTEVYMQTTGTAPQLASNTDYGKNGSAKTPKGGKGKKH